MVYGLWFMVYGLWFRVEVWFWVCLPARHRERHVPIGTRQPRRRSPGEAIPGSELRVIFTYIYIYYTFLIVIYIYIYIYIYRAPRPDRYSPAPPREPRGGRTWFRIEG